MTEERTHRPERLGDAYEETLRELGAEDPTVTVLEADRTGAGPTSPFAERFPDRFVDVRGAEATMIERASELARSGRTVFVGADSVDLAARSYRAVRTSVCQPRADVKLVATRSGLGTSGDAGGSSMLEDVALMRGLPGMTVVVPGDAPTTRSALRAVRGFKGPAYVRLTAEALPVVTDGTFALGKAPELRGGSDLTIVAIGTLLSRALEVSDELRKVGVAARVLDFASIKPFDAPSLLKAARETGAILTMEEHSVLTGLGTLVAATVAENHPVPVRRIGVPDLFGEPGEPRALLDRYGLSTARALEEAWELLRQRGKVN